MGDISLFKKNDRLALILKTAGNSCNIACDYCFEKVKNVDTSVVSAALLEEIILKLVPGFSVTFHGGEPLIIGVDNFSKLLEVVEKYYPTRISYIRIQTNGTLINQEWIDLLFKKYKHLNIEIAISLDGTQDMNFLRVDRFGNSTYDKVVKAIKLLDDNGIKTGLLSVVNKKMVNNGKEYVDFLASLPNLRFVKLNALFNITDNELSKDSLTPMEYAYFILEVAKYYIESKLYEKFAIEPILSAMQRMNGLNSRYCNYSEEKCYHYICVYPDGKMGPCDCLSIDEFSLGYINEHETLEACVLGALNAKCAQSLREMLMRCDDCDIKSFCIGGCLSHRYYFKGNMALYEEFCASKKYLYDKFSNFKL